MYRHRWRVELWLEDMEIANYTINEDLTVNVNGDVHLNNSDLKILPVQFNRVDGHFYINDNPLKSSYGVPQTVTGSFDISFCGLSTVDWFITCQSLNLCGNQLSHFKNIHKFINCESATISGNSVKSGILYWLLIPNIKHLYITGKGYVNDIMKKHIVTKNILDCQEELIEAGYSELALL